MEFMDKMLGLFLPTFVDLIEEAGPQNDQELAQLFGAAAAEIKGAAQKNNPSIHKQK